MTRNVLLLLAVYSSLVLLQCSNKKENEFPRAAIVVGDVELVRNGQTLPLVKDMALRSGDTVRVSENAKIKFELKDDGAWYLGNGTRIVFGEPVALSENKKRLQLTLVDGQMYVMKKNDREEEYSITTSQWILRVTSADISIGAGNSETSCCVVLLRGFSTFMVPGNNETILPECTKLDYNGSGPGELQPISGADIAQLKSWIGTSVIDDALTNSDCGRIGSAAPMEQNQEQTPNRPPEWRTVLGESAIAGEPIVDTLVADDPEQQQVTYQIIKGIAGMKLNPQTGRVTYTPATTGEFRVVLSAADPLGASCTTSVQVTVTAGLSVRLFAPRTIQPGVPFTVSARLGSKSPGKYAAAYRFDLDGNGTFETPGGGKYGKKSTITGVTLSSEGKVRLRVEVKGDDEQKASASRLVVVNTPPKVVFSINPRFVQTGTPVAFDVSASRDSRDGAGPLQVSYDVNGDGIADIPEKNRRCTSDKPCLYTFSQAGTYLVTATVTDRDGAAASASSTVTVSNGIEGGVLQAPETVSVNMPVTVVCTGFGPATTIKAFTWETDGAGVASREEKENTLKLSFKSAGEVTVSCRVTDDKMQSATLQHRIMVIDAAAEVDAGGPYATEVNKPVTLAGKAKDIDTKIVRYSWDADGDGTAEWSSESEMKTDHTYVHAGTYKAVFSIVGADGTMAGDTAIVTVSNKPPKASAGKDIISRKNRKVELNGTGTDEDGPIVLYEWDFNGDGTFDWSSKESGSTVHQFEAYSKAVLRVKDADGEAGLDTVTIIICPDGMETIEDGPFCIDKYEYPGKRKSVPRTDVTYQEAEKLCAQQGKRLCTADEWEMACRNNREKNNYPYGKRFDSEKCNTLGNPRLKNSIAPAGDFIECKGKNDLYDMSGNVAEWVRVNDGSHFAYGGSWQNGKEGSSCTSRVKLQKGRKYFYTGFRCCK